MFSSVEDILFLGDASPNFARALELVSAEMAADVLPALRELTIDPVSSESRKAVTSFIDARNLASLPAIKVTM